MSLDLQANDNIGGLIRADRVAQGLSLQGLADKLNADRSLGLDKTVTTSWLHHLENNRAKALTTVMKKGLARALSQEETKYLTSHESLDKRRQSFSKFFDEEIPSFEQGSTLICDFQVHRLRPAEVSELLLCIYQFLVATDGTVTAFERSEHIALPILLTAIRSWPNIDDLNPNNVISKILAPGAADGFLTCTIPTPSKETLQWVARKVHIFEMTADEQATQLLATDPLHYMGVVSPSARDGLPLKRLYYFLNPREYGVLKGIQCDLGFQRFKTYRDHDLFTPLAYEEGFAFSFEKMGSHYHLKFRDSAQRVG